MSESCRCEDNVLCQSFDKLRKLMNNVSQEENIAWFAWGDFALALLMEEIPKDNTAEIIITSVSQSNVDKAFSKIIALSKTLNLRASHTYSYLRLECKKSGLNFNILSNTKVDTELNEFRMFDANLLRNVSYKLNRVMPLANVSYFDICVPVPKDPLYVFSHIVPSKDTNGTVSVCYKYKQGCRHLCKRGSRLQTISKRTYMTCSQYVTFCNQCGLDSPRESFFPLETIIGLSPKNNLLYLEDFQHVIPLEKGSGEYSLTNPTGTSKAALTWSQFGQDLYVDNYFNRKQNGFFVEIGGFDGERFSNTLFLEKYRNWNGLLVEAIPNYYEQMKQKHRKCYILNACVSASDDSQTFIDADVLSSSEKTLTKQHKERIEKTKLLKQKTRIKVFCKRFLDILDVIGHRHIDYFSLDVEGAELIILNAIPWDTVDIELFTIETDQHRDEIISFMERQGYERTHKLTIDDVFRKKA